MQGYLTKQECVAIPGAGDLVIRSLLDRQQYDDPLGEADRLGISSAAWPLFGLIWPSGLRLAARLSARPVRPGERILEIGCGLAVASLAGHRLGADVTASDRHPLAQHFLNENLRLNNLSPMKYLHGPWDGASDPTLIADDQRYDLIIGSDVLYERDDAGTLAGFIGRHCRAHAEVWIVDPDRGNRSAFNRQMARLDFSMTEERLDTPSSATSLAYKGRMLIYRKAASTTSDVAPYPD